MKQIVSMFGAVLTVTPWATLLILALMGLRAAAGKRLSPRFFQLAFLVLAVRLALPVDFSLPAAPVRVELPQSIEAETVAEQPGLPLIDAPQQFTPLPRPEVPGVPAVPVPPARPAFPWAEVLSAVWLAGAAAFLGWHLAAYGHFCRSLHRSRTPAPEDIHRQAAAAFGRPVRVYLADGISSPMLAGLARPAVYLPAGGVSRENLLFVLAHEACHARRRDVPGQFLLLAAQSVHWFNPLVHWMARLARIDMERGCDEAVLHGHDLEYRRAYGIAVLASLTADRARRAPALSTGFSSGEDLKRRFRDMFDLKQKSRGLPLLAALMALVIGASALVACGAEPVIVQEEASSVPAVSEAASSLPVQPSLPTAEADAPEVFVGLSGGDWGWPMEEGDGLWITRVMSDRHRGMDIEAEMGTPVLAMFDGTVTLAMSHYSYGWVLDIRSEDGRVVRYAHCSELLVQEGDTVTAGQMVAKVGNTGASTGPHLHVETFVPDADAQPDHEDEIGQADASGLKRVQPADVLTIPAGVKIPLPEEWREPPAEENAEESAVPSGDAGSEPFAESAAE